MRKFLSTMAVMAVLTPGLGWAADAVTIATVGPMTGQLATYGAQMKRGAELAVADINAAGGVLGRQVTLEVQDDACDPKQAVAVANQVAIEHVALVAGHFCSGSSIPASGVYAEEGILMITPSSTSPTSTDDAAAKGWQNILRANGRDDQQGEVAGEFILQHYADKHIAIIHDKSTAGKGIADVTKAYLNAHGVQETLYDSYTAGEKDYRGLVAKLKNAAIDIIYVGGYHTEGALIIKQAREAGLQAQMIGNDSFATSEFTQVAGPAAEGVLITNAAEVRDLPSAQDVVAKFRAQGFEPEGYTLNTYAVVQLWAEAAKRAGSIDTDALAAELRKGSYQTVVGTLEFDAKGDLKKSNYAWYVVKGGAFVPVK